MAMLMFWVRTALYSTTITLTESKCSKLQHNRPSVSFVSQFNPAYMVSDICLQSLGPWPERGLSPVHSWCGVFLFHPTTSRLPFDGFQKKSLLSSLFSPLHSSSCPPPPPSLLCLYLYLHLYLPSLPWKFKFHLSSLFTVPLMVICPWFIYYSDPLPIPISFSINSSLRASLLNSFEEEGSLGGSLSTSKFTVVLRQERG